MSEQAKLKAYLAKRDEDKARATLRQLEEQYACRSMEEHDFRSWVAQRDAREKREKEAKRRAERDDY